MNHSDTDSQKNQKAESSKLQDSEMPESNDDMIEVPSEPADEIIWSGDSSICSKKLKHYPAFIRDGTTIAIHSFALILARDGSNNVGYLEDMYEDRRGRKMVKVRWLHHNEEVSGVTPELQPHEVIITPDVQSVNAECIDGLATVLTPKHYQQCLNIVSQDFSDGIFMCSRQMKWNRITSFPVHKLRGYSNQTIFSALDTPIVPNNPNQVSPTEEQQETVAREQLEETVARQELNETVATEEQEETLAAEELVKIVDGSEQHHQVPLFSVGEEIEVLSQDSGMRGCWFRCKILQVSEKLLKVLYVDVEDVESPGNLEEWVIAHRVAAPDKLGMRWLGRHTIRPWPAKASSNGCFNIGTPVDAWWCDAWWEGVVVGTDVCGKNIFRVYFPGENRFQNLENKNLRSSKDWVDNRWVEITPKPDILSFVSSNVNSQIKLQRWSTLNGSSSQTEAAAKEGQEPPPVPPATNVMKDVPLKKRTQMMIKANMLRNGR